MALLVRHAPGALMITAASALLLSAAPQLAAAQGAPPPAGPATAPPPAAPPSEELPPPPPPPTYAEPSGGECTPACRSGFTCQSGQCVSLCNPPCAAGEQCTAQGECTACGYSSAPSFPEPQDDIPPPPRDGVEQHDGFMLRLTLGGGGAGAGLDTPGITVEYSGGGGAFSLDIGGSPTDNLVIHVRISDFVMIDPTVTTDAGPLSGSMEGDGSFGSNFFGVGLTYYFMPVNLYLTAALGAGWLTTREDGQDESSSTDVGVGFDFDVGKEWWVSDNWGLGIAGRFSLVSGTTTIENTDVEADFAMAAFALLFSATYQ
jgi:hypothetical protein